MKKSDPASHLQEWKIVAKDPLPAHGLYWESLLALGNGYLGTRGAREESTASKTSQPLTLIAEVFDRPPLVKGEVAKLRRPTRLAPAPNWLCIEYSDGKGKLFSRGGKVLSETIALDMQRGVLTRTGRYKGKGGRITRLVTKRIVSQARAHVAAIQYSVTPENYAGEVTLTSALDGNVTYPDGVMQTKAQAQGAEGQTLHLAVKTLQSKIVIAQAARHTLSVSGKAVTAAVATKSSAGKIALTYKFDAKRNKTYVLEKMVEIDTSVRNEDPLATVVGAVAQAPAFAQLEAENTAAWADYWRDCDVKITGDRFVQTLARFFVFQLLQACSKNNVKLGLSANIGAKTMSGWGYGGRVFWDTEIYMLPFFSQQYPDIARSLLGYRYDRLEAAAKNAKAFGCGGVKFPWESAGTGEEECPKWLKRRDGTLFRWRGAEQEMHINADVPFGYWQHFSATGDDRLLLSDGLDILIGTAHFWSDRVSAKKVGKETVYEIKKVIGPDEYHHSVNNSVYTNAMARWNLIKALDLLQLLRENRPEKYLEMITRHKLTDEQMARWRDIADHIQINFDAQTGLYEQFDGYFKHEKKQIKQADVLLMLYLLPEMRTQEIFRRNFDLYHPVTLHSSSLSPGVHVLFALDVGCKEKAYEYELQACSIDGVRQGEGTDSGLHAASLGGGWSSIVAGFGGVRVMPDCLRVAPQLPDKWKRLEFSLRFRGLRMRFDIRPHRVIVQADMQGPTVDLEIAGERRRLSPGKKIEQQVPKTGLRS